MTERRRHHATDMKHGQQHHEIGKDLVQLFNRLFAALAILAASQNVTRPAKV